MCYLIKTLEPSLGEAAPKEICFNSLCRQSTFLKPPVPCCSEGGV